MGFDWQRWSIPPCCPEHPDTLNSIHNLAGLLEAHGQLAEAKPLYREALERSLELSFQAVEQLSVEQLSVGTVLFQFANVVLHCAHGLSLMEGPVEFC